MNLLHRFTLALGLMGLLSPLSSSAQLLDRNRSALADEPGTLSVEGLLDRPLTLKVAREARIYYASTFDRVLGTMAPGTPVSLVAMSDTGYRVRGRARHGDVAGWMLKTDVISADPNLGENLKKLYERQLRIQELIDANEVALGMTVEEVELSLGRPTRRSSKLTAAGRDDMLEYAVYDRVPQTVTGRDGLGRIVQSIVYVKVEVGTLSITFRDNVAEEIEEKKGNPLGTGGVKIVVPPIIVR